MFLDSMTSIMFKVFDIWYTSNHQILIVFYSTVITFEMHLMCLFSILFDAFIYFYF